MATLTLTRVQKDSGFGAAWDGDVFYTANSARYGIIDALGLCKLLKLKYVSCTKVFAGDFCVLPKYAAK